MNELDELPQVLIMENVTQVHGTKNKENFKLWCDFLENKGYHNYWQDLNARDYGVPQNRKRCFMVSILNGTYEFPKSFELKCSVNDYLEDEKDILEDYYKVCPSMRKALEDGKVKDITDKEYCNTITTKQERWNNGGMINKGKLRYLTTKECCRLMGFNDDDYNKIKDINSKNQLYKQFGNSIVVNVLEEIFKQLLKEN